MVLNRQRPNVSGQNEIRVFWAYVSFRRLPT